MHIWDEMKAYVGFDEQDAARLAALLPSVEPHLPAIADDFYATIQRFPRARSVLDGDAQIAHLKGTLQEWIRQLLTGPHDRAYWRRRLRIGEAHVRVGLPQRYVFTAMSLLRSRLCELSQAALDREEAWLTCRALDRITDLELAVICENYQAAHEEQELRTLQDLIVQNMPVTVLCLNEAGRVTSATHPPSGLIGERAELGQPYDAFLSQRLVQAADLPRHLERMRATGREITLPQTSIGQGREARHFRLTLVPLEHELARVLLHIEELTDVVQAQARAQQAEHLARLGHLAANVAHEIRNPLSAISATLQVIGSSLGTDDRRAMILSKVNGQVLRLDRLVSDLLGYARPAEPNSRPVRLSRAAREAITTSGVLASLQVIEDLTVLADGLYVQQILINLLQNARDAVENEGNITVQIGPGARLAVSDDGPGISPEIARKLFEPFVTTKARGTGLGLAISRKLAESMDGHLQLDPTSDASTCFVLTLPQGTSRSPG